MEIAMRIAFAVCVLLGSSLSADEVKDKKAVEAEMKKLEGTWEGYAVEGQGENPDRGPVHLRLTFTGAKIKAFDLAKDGKDMGSGTCTLDPSKQLKEIDATGIVLPGRRERTYPGIYKVDGDTLKWCVDNRRKGRPKEFRTANGKYLLILKRKKKAPKGE
jgi:uncharacterized protein (TIGR03067 family)